MMAGGYVKVVKVMKVDRVAGWSIENKPPQRLKGSIGVITRPLINWNGYHVLFLHRIANSNIVLPEKYVLAKEELKEASEKEIKGFKELEDIMYAKEVARKL